MLWWRGGRGSTRRLLLFTFVIGSGQPAHAGEPEVAEDTTPRLGGEALEKALPDLQNTSWPPASSVTFGVENHYPLQVTGVGIGGEGYLGNSLRIELLYSAGVALQGSEPLFTNYGKALIGLKLFGGFADLQIDAKPPRRTDASGKELPTTPLLKAWLPAYHALLLEAGAISGVIPLGRCSATCLASDADNLDAEYVWERPQLVYPLAGLRYVFSLGSRSKRLPELNRKFVFQLFGHALYRPFFDSRHELYWPRSEERVERFFVGGEGGFVIPICVVNCINLALAVGYLPAPASVFFDAAVRYSIEPATN